jgi:hypothetical protein
MLVQNTAASLSSFWMGEDQRLGTCESLPDRVTSSQADPLRNRSVLLLGSGELLLRAEGLVALLNVSSASILQISTIPSIHALVQSLPPSSNLAHPITLKGAIAGRTYRHRDDCRGVEVYVLLRCHQKLSTPDLQNQPSWDRLASSRAFRGCRKNPGGRYFRKRTSAFDASGDVSLATADRNTEGRGHVFEFRLLKLRARHNHADDYLTGRR